MKLVLAIYLGVAIGFLGCNTPSESSGNLANAPITANERAEPGFQNESVSQKNTFAFKNFEINIGVLTLKARVDETNQATIDYPVEWMGKASLVRFDGQPGRLSPFSKNHCEEMRESAASGFGNLLIRGGYHSSLIFDTPPFVSSDFFSMVENSAQAAGLRLEFLTLNNPVDNRNASVELALSDKAISQLLGNTSVFREQFNINKVGVDLGFLQTKLIITSGDIICDLISGDAKLTITYPIINSDKKIMVTYDSLAVKIKPLIDKGSDEG